MRDVLALIGNASLSHPLGPLLTCFVTEALNPTLAAEHVRETCHASGVPIANLLSLVSDWTYIVESCVASMFSAFSSNI